MIIDIFVPFGGQGGVERVINDMALHMIKRGERVRVIQLTYDEFDWVKPPIEFYPLLHNAKVNELNECADLYAAFIQQYGAADVVLATPFPFLTYMAKRAVLMIGVHTRIISWLHAPIEIYEKYGTGSYAQLAFADSNFVLTKKAVQSIHTMLPDREVRLVTNPIHLEGISICPGAADYKSQTLVYVGRLSKEKQVNVIIQALALTQSAWKCIIIGSGEEQQELCNLAEYMGVAECIEWRGWQENPWNQLENVTATVISSEYEGFSLTAIESLARGIPVISAPVDGISEYVKPGFNGFFYGNQSDTDKTARELAKVLNMITDGVFAPIEPQNCRKSIEQYEYSRSVEEFYRNVLEVADAQ